jgi:undecaprenyl-diphosphatase
MIGFAHNMADACLNTVDIGFAELGYYKVAFLGVVQGITELLPISSTAHMRVIPALLGWRDPGSAFSAAMQLAALVAVACYFRNDVSQLIKFSFRALIEKNFEDPYLRLSVWIVLATIPIGASGLALSGILNTCESPLRSLAIIGVSCIVMSVALALAEIFSRHTRLLESANLRDALIVGLAQVGALIPGVSRSGSTITAALALGFKRSEAARFSFLLGIPAIALAGAKEIWELKQIGLPVDGWLILSVGLLFGSVSAFVAIWILMRFLEKFSSWPFVVYRFAFGVVILILYTRQ